MVKSHRVGVICVILNWLEGANFFGSNQRDSSSDLRLGGTAFDAGVADGI